MYSCPSVSLSRCPIVSTAKSSCEQSQPKAFVHRYWKIYTLQQLLGATEGLVISKALCVGNKAKYLTHHWAAIDKEEEREKQPCSGFKDCDLLILPLIG